MATLALAAVGSAIAGSAATAAGAVAGGFLATAAGAAGGFAGSLLGGVIDNALFGTTQQLPDVVGPRLADTSIQVSTYGNMIPIVYGRIRLAGNIIWSAGIEEVRIENTTEQQTGGKGGGGQTTTQTSVTYEYYVTLAIAICEGEINEITRVWADSKPLGEDVLDSGNDKYNTYFGTETQNADTIIESFEGSGNVPGFRGLAYVVIKDFPLHDFGNRIPNFTFEVVRKVQDSSSVEENVKDIVLIPGSGEFIYDTTLIEKQTGERLPDETFVSGGIADQLNMHNFDNVADVKIALDNMQNVLPNVERVNLVVSWYSTSKFLASSDVVPKAENGPDTSEYFPADWTVGSVTRSTAELITVRGDGTLNFGGTPSDQSIINLAVELKARGLEVMFYPFLGIDTDGTEGGGEESKPWRGRMIPTSTAEVNTWFTKTDGYNDFIEHYANLTVGGTALKDNIDKFVIGSEMRGITQYMPSAGVFPGVTNFISLAATIKGIVGGGVEVGYAADWSEYSQVNGWFNMDPLWTDSNIDFIGIDYYMPLTPDLDQSQITPALITQYIEDGEGWAYFFDDSENRTSTAGTDPFATTASSDTVTYTHETDHNLSIGQEVEFAGCTGDPGGIPNADINGKRTILATPTGTTFTFQAGSAASSTTSGGGSAVTIDQPEYFVPDDGTSIYAWKSIENWWKAADHENPDTSDNWTSKAKKIIFTEFGFPSVDGCTNQPNVFVDPTSVESFYPRESRRRVDFNAQRAGIKAMIDFWQAKNLEAGNSDLVPEMYLWTWDARPFPFFPDLVNVWSDGPNWRTGHWVQGKLGGSSLAAIVGDLLQKVGLATTDYDVSRLNDIVDGYINTTVMSVRDWLQQLSIAYQFDMVESDGVLKFIPRGGVTVSTIQATDLQPLAEGQTQNLVNITRKQELELPQEVNVTFLDRDKNYQNNTQLSQRQTVSSVDKQSVNLPIVLTPQSAQNLSDVLLYNQWTARNTFTFTLSNKHIELEPTDIIDLVVSGVTHTIKITRMSVGNVLSCEGVSEDVASYDFYTAPGTSVVQRDEGNVIPETTAILLDLPVLPGEVQGTAGTLRAAIGPSNEGNWAGANLYRSDDGGEAGGNTWGVIGEMVSTSILGTTLTALPAVTNTDTFDLLNTVDVYLKSGTLTSATELAVLNGANACVIGNEVLQFQNVTILDSDPKKLRLDKLLRGRLGTEFAAAVEHAYGSDFVLLTPNNLKIGVPFSLFGVERYYKPVTVGEVLANTDEQLFTYTGVAYRPYSPVHASAYRDENSDWQVSWVRRTRTGGELLDNIGTVPLNEETEAYEIDVLDGMTVVNTYTSTSPGFTYTLAQQEADFGEVQNEVDLCVYQMSSVIGRGTPYNFQISTDPYVDADYVDDDYI